MRVKGFIFPPRPKGKIFPGLLPDYEQSGEWVAQRKFKGDHILIHICEKSVRLFTRDGKPLSRFATTPELIQQFLSLDLSEKEYWLAGELLNNHTKTPEYKGKIVLFDVLFAGRYLFGRPEQISRLKLLSTICRMPTSREPANGIALLVTDNIWLAETFEVDFMTRFQDFLDLREIEGLVLRRKASVIDDMGQKEYSVPWIVRCRKSDTNYQF